MAESKAQNISSQLWAIANDLRGTMDASSFKDYILPFLFYKYLSIHQEEYLVNNDLVDISDENLLMRHIRSLSKTQV